MKNARRPGRPVPGRPCPSPAPGAGPCPHRPAAASGPPRHETHPTPSTTRSPGPGRFAGRRGTLRHPPAPAPRAAAAAPAPAGRRCAPGPGRCDRAGRGGRAQPGRPPRRRHRILHPRPGHHRKLEQAAHRGDPPVHRRRRRPAPGAEPDHPRPAVPPGAAASPGSRTGPSPRHRPAGVPPGQEPQEVQQIIRVSPDRRRRERPRPQMLRNRLPAHRPRRSPRPGDHR